MYSREESHSISLRGGQRALCGRRAGQNWAGASRPAPLAAMGRATRDGNSEIQRSTTVERGFPTFSQSSGCEGVLIRCRLFLNFGSGNVS
jgi:hypothetical protein